MEYIHVVNGNFRTAVPIRVENVGFDMFGKLMGSDGRNMIYIEECTGVQLNLDGEGAAFMQQDPRPGPLRLTIQHATEKAVIAAIPLVEHLVNTMQTDYKKYMEEITLQDPNIKDGIPSQIAITHPYFMVIPLDVEPTNDFKLFDLLLGTDGNNLVYIEQCTEACLAIDGEAATHINPTANMGPVRIVIRHATKEGLAEAVSLVESLIEVVQDEYKTYFDNILKGQTTDEATESGQNELYCEVCDLQCEEKEAFIAHCRGALHTSNQLAQKVGHVPKGPATPPDPVVPHSSQHEPSPLSLPEPTVSKQVSDPPHYHYAFQQRFFADLMISQCQASSRSIFQSKIRFQNIPRDMAADLLQKSRNKSHCLVCDIGLDTGYGMQNHYAQRKHQAKYLSLQLKYGVKNFSSVFASVPVPGVPVRGGQQYATGILDFHNTSVEVQGVDKCAYEEMVLLSGLLSRFNCKVCRFNALNNQYQQWVSHIQSKPHAQACINLLKEVGPNVYLYDNRTIPAPCPCKVKGCFKQPDADEIAQSEYDVQMVPLMDDAYWERLPEIVAQERAAQRESRPHEDDQAGSRKRPCTEKSRDHTESKDETEQLVSRLRSLTKVRDEAILRSAVSHLVRNQVDIAYVSRLLDSKNVKAMLEGRGQPSNSLAKVIEQIVNFGDQ